MEVNAMNPLLIPTIIQEVYKYLRFHDKKTFRVVCTTWIDTTLQLWRKQTKLVIQDENYNVRGYFSSSENDRPSAHDFFLKYYELYGIGEKPLFNLELIGTNLSFLPFDCLKNVDNFLVKSMAFQIQIVQNLLVKHYGHSLERLELVDCTFVQNGRFEAGFYHILLNFFPKLKVLSVRHPTITLNFDQEHCELEQVPSPITHSDLNTLNLAAIKLSPETARRIFKLIPNLKNLSLRGRACNIFKALQITPKSGKHILLERLGIDSVYNLKILIKIPAWIKNYLDAARPPLKCLKASIPFGKFPPVVEYIDFPEEPFIYKPVWTCVGNTLTSLNLRIWIGLWSWCTLFSGFTLPKLTHLCIFFREVKHKSVELLHFDFGMLRGTPLLQLLILKLETIHSGNISKVGTNLEKHELEWRSSSWNGSIVLKHMKDFQFELYHKPTEGCWRAFAEMMPNLRKLQGILDGNTKAIVRQLWPDLNFLEGFRFRPDEDESSKEFGDTWEEHKWENWQEKIGSVR